MGRDGEGGEDEREQEEKDIEAHGKGGGDLGIYG